MTINIKVCEYNLCLTLSLGHKLLYPATCTFLRKQTLNLCCGHYVMSATLRYLFFSSSTQFTVFSFAIDAAQLVQCILYFNLKIFPGSAFSAQKSSIEKCCGHYTLVLQTSYNLESSFNFFLNFLDLSVLVLGIAMDLLYNQLK